MISDLNILHVSPASYSVIIGGNQGEEELIISHSPGQDSKTALIVTAMTVDGGGRIIYPREHLPPRVPTAQVPGILKTILTTWCHGGIKPQPAEAEALAIEIASVLETIGRIYQMQDY